MGLVSGMESRQMRLSMLLILVLIVAIFFVHTRENLANDTTIYASNEENLVDRDRIEIERLSRLRTADVYLAKNNIVLPVVERRGKEVDILTPCGVTMTVPDTVWSKWEGIRADDITVVIDPGHGGVGYIGAVGGNGTQEKHLALETAQVLQKALEKKDIPSILTRTGDYQLTIPVRTYLANKVQPELFISIHYNGGFNTTTSKIPGTEIFYQNKNAESLRAATSVYPLLRDALATVGSDVQYWYATKYPGVRKVYVTRTTRDFYGILRRTNGVFANTEPVPSILVEIGFLPNPEEEVLYNDNENIIAIADSMARGINLYLAGKEADTTYVHKPTYANTSTHNSGNIFSCNDPNFGV